MTGRTRTLLWALRSPCNLGCRYCYFGTIEDHRAQPVVGVGQLSHLARTDLDAAEVLRFAATLADSAVARVFLAGGEPLIWPPILDLLATLTAAGVEAVVCTNGIPLNRPGIVAGLLDAGVAAVSVSLDSVDPAYNDRWRPARNGHDGHPRVLSGIRALLRARGPHRAPRVGIYSVITRANLTDVTAVAELAGELGCDYVVPQPISLPAGHPLTGTLALTPDHARALTRAYTALYDNPPAGIRLPSRPFPDQVARAVRSATATVRGCFGGHTLNFIEPDGTVWDCPSGLRIAATAPEARRTIRGANAADLFGPPTGPPADCPMFGVDCVNMWPLMRDFDSTPTSTPDEARTGPRR